MPESTGLQPTMPRLNEPAPNFETETTQAAEARAGEGYDYTDWSFSKKQLAPESSL